MKDNTLRDDIDELVTEASRYDMRSTDYDNITDKILTLLAEEVRKAVVKELKDIKNKFANAELFRGDPKNKLQIEDIYKHFFDNDIKPLVESVLNDRIKQLEKGK